MALVKNLRIQRKLAKMFTVIYIITVCIILCSPLIISSLDLPLSIVIPFLYPDTRAKILINYLSQIIQAYMAWTVNVFGDAINLSTFLMISLKSDVLTILIKDFNNVVRDQRVSDNIKMKKILLIVKTHQEYLRYTNYS